jgi:deoxycytidylate deaminase
MLTKLVFIKDFEALKNTLHSLGGEWDASHPTRKVLRIDGAVMNWFESTGTLQFQGKEDARDILEKKVRLLLSPETASIPTNSGLHLKSPAEDTVTPTLSTRATDPNIPQTPSVNEQSEEPTDVRNYLDGNFVNSEVVIGIVSAVGTDSSRVITPLADRLKLFGYDVETIRVSELLVKRTPKSSSEYTRIRTLMEAGDKLRKMSGRNSILAAGVTSRIKSLRDPTRPKRAYLLNSLKHPEEVEMLRRIYGEAFFLVGIHADEKRRLKYLEEDKGLTALQATELTKIDEDEDVPHGQRTRDTFHLSDFFINLGKNDDQVKHTVQRFLELIFGHPYRNPTFDEFAMFMAFCSSIRSGDLSRQVGAIVARDKQILATGANECPTYKGGQYWADVDPNTGQVTDRSEGKDYTWELDSNKNEQREIISQILEKTNEIKGMDASSRTELQRVLEASRIRDLTEFGRVVHAEMDALLSCARSGISTRDAILYCTTFPCHNCAKHIIGAGIIRLIYVEPYPKSKALELHDDSIELQSTPDDQPSKTKVVFEPFTGVGARRFLDLFSMSLGAGSKLKRKDSSGNIVNWSKDTARMRIPILPNAYLHAEEEAMRMFNEVDAKKS